MKILWRFAWRMLAWLAFVGATAMATEPIAMFASRPFLVFPLHKKIEGVPEIQLVHTPRLRPDGSIAASWSVPIASYALMPLTHTRILLTGVGLAEILDARQAGYEFIPLRYGYSYRHYSSTWEVRQPDGMVLIFNDFRLRGILVDDEYWRWSIDMNRVWTLRSAEKVIQLELDSSGILQSIRINDLCWTLCYDDEGRLVEVNTHLSSDTASFSYGKDGLLDRFSGFGKVLWSRTRQKGGIRGLMIEDIIVLQEVDGKRYRYHDLYDGEDIRLTPN